MTKKSLILPDTVVVIDAHENDYWEPICREYSLVLPSTIIENEAFYYQSERGKKGLNPTSWIKNNQITRVDAELSDFALLAKKLSPDFMSSLDAGELEALAILMSKKNKDVLFTTADRAAIRALGILGLGNRGLSVEELVKNIRLKRKLPAHLTKKWFEQVVAEGFREQHLWLRK